MEERQLAESNLLDVPRLDVLNAVDVLEIQLQLVDDKALDLIGAHADEVEEDIDLWNVERGEDVHPHPLIGQDSQADQPDDQHHGRDGMIHREDVGVKRSPPFRGSIGHKRSSLIGDARPVSGHPTCLQSRLEARRAECESSCDIVTRRLARNKRRGSSGENNVRLHLELRSMSGVSFDRRPAGAALTGDHHTPRRTC